jgi:hypothetical protein
MTDTAPRWYRFPRPEQRAVLIGLRPAQVAVVGGAVAAAIAAVMAMPSGGGLLLGLLAVLTGLPVAVLPVQGRTLDQWLPVLSRWGAVVAGRHRFWASTTPTQGDTATHEWADPPPPLAGLKLLRVRRPGAADVAVAVDRRHALYLAVIACKGQAFALLDPAEQDRLAGVWGQVLASLAQEGSPVARIAWVERAVPEDGDALAAHLADHATLDPDHPAFTSYRDLISEAGPVSQTHDTYIVLGVGGTRARRAFRHAGRGDDGACEVLLRELAVLTDRLGEAEIDVAEVLDPPAVARLLRSAFDPRAVRPLASQARRHPSRIGPTGRNAWPLATRVEWDHYRTDSGFHTTFWVADLPRRHVGAAFLFPLILKPTSTRSVAVVMEPVPPSTAARAVESAHASHLADEELRAKAGYLPSARRRREHEAIVAREAELADGHAEYRFSAYVTVTAPDLEALERAAGEIEQLGYDAGVELRRLYGEQDAAFTYTLPLARGLK